MKVACLSEWRPDEAAVATLLTGLLGREIELVDPPLRANGWPAVRQDLPAVLRALHYRAAADALVVVVDSNNSRLDAGREPERRETKEEPRLVQLRRIVRDVLATLRPLPGRQPLKTAVGLAVPCIEAWLRCGVDPNVSEAAWARGLREGRLPYTVRDLKVAAYGSDRAGEVVKTARSLEEASRLAERLDLLERKFPCGFGALAEDVRGWG